jgi:hypothetical protein
MRLILRRLGLEARAAIIGPGVLLSPGILEGVTFVATCFGRALLQIYVDHISFIVNPVALRHDAFSGAKNRPSGTAAFICRLS